MSFVEFSVPGHLRRAGYQLCDHRCFGRRISSPDELQPRCSNRASHFYLHYSNGDPNPINRERHAVSNYEHKQAYAGCLGPVAWIYASEIFPSNLRDKGVNISQVGQQASTLWINQTWPVMFMTVGHNAYYILMGINVISLTVVVLFWPETKGISLEHMSRVFGELDQVEMYEKEVQATQAHETNQNVKEEVA